MKVLKINCVFSEMREDGKGSNQHSALSSQPVLKAKKRQKTQIRTVRDRYFKLTSIQLQLDFNFNSGLRKVKAASGMDY